MERPDLSTGTAGFTREQRSFAAIAAMLLTAYLAYTFSSMWPNTNDHSLMRWLILLAAPPALLCWWIAVDGGSAAARGEIRSAVRGGLIVGGIGFAGGFFGPMLFASDSPQGPLLGIFFTGPLGFALGLLGAIVMVFYRRTRARREAHP